MSSKNNNGQTPLHYICTMRGAEFAKAAIELLLQFGAKVDEVDSTGRTPVQIAMLRGAFSRML
ncbi:hypothetical protein C8R45DRAFT_954942 [Mycena sanguinolenta]|nr:hypothetical protein C8R45DRAFT_954942 [Mycena sanguinolenta]